MSQISDKVGYYVMEIKGQDDIMDTCEYPKGNIKIVVFDDLVSALDKIQSKIACHFKDGRHHDFSPIYLIQSYSDVPQKLRLNCSHVILYPPVTKNHCNPNYSIIRLFDLTCNTCFFDILPLLTAPLSIV